MLSICPPVSRALSLSLSLSLCVCVWVSGWARSDPHVVPMPPVQVKQDLVKLGCLPDLIALLDNSGSKDVQYWALVLLHAIVSEQRYGSTR